MAAPREALLERLPPHPAFPGKSLPARGLRDQSPAPGGHPLETLEARESRSSLAGVLLGAAVEGIGLFGLVDGAEVAASVLDTPNLTSEADGIADIRAGRIDGRVVAVLNQLSREHHL